jgi:hypothetical protein
MCFSYAETRIVGRILENGLSFTPDATFTIGIGLSKPMFVTTDS